MEKEYKSSRIIIAALAVIVSSIVLINEDISLKIAGISLFTVVAILASFLLTKVSQKMIRVGDEIPSGATKVLYYFSLLLIPFGVIVALWFVLYIVMLVSILLGTMNMTLDQAIILVFIGAGVFILFLVPYIQSLIVVALRRIKNK